MAVRHLGGQALAARRPAPERSHVGLGPGLVDEDEAGGIDEPLPRRPLGPLPRHVGAVLFGRNQRLMGWPAPPSLSALRCRSDPEGEERTMAIAVLGIDLGKNSCSVAGLDGTGRVVLRRGDDRRQASASRHHEARQHLSAHTPDPWRPSGLAVALGQPESDGRVVARPHWTSPQEQGHRRARRQARPDRLGSPAFRRDLCEGGTAGGGLNEIRPLRQPSCGGQRCLWAVDARWPDG